MGSLLAWLEKVLGIPKLCEPVPFTGAEPFFFHSPKPDFCPLGRRSKATKGEQTQEL